MKTILIVDDSDANLYLLRVILENAGYSVIEAKDGREGLQKLYHSKTDMIISDILMPIMDGYLFCQACKKEKLFKKIPFVFYTSTYTERTDKEFALKLGAAKFLNKSIDQEELIEIVKDIFEKTQTQKDYVKKVRINDEEVLKLYSERLINKLEEKTLELKIEIVERKKIEQVLIHEIEVMDLINLNTPLDKILDHIILNFESTHPGYFGSVNLVNQEGTHLEPISAPNMSKAYISAFSKIRIANNVGSCGTAAFLKKPVIVSDISKDPLWETSKSVALKYNLNSCWSVPILNKEKKVLGTVAIYSHIIQSPSLNDIKDLNFAVNLANIAIEKKNAANEIKKKEESYKSLFEQASDAIFTFTFDGKFHSFNQSASTILGYSKEEFEKLSVPDIIEGEFIESTSNYEKIQSGIPVIVYRKLIRKDRTIIETEVSLKLQTDGRVLGIVRDITERNKIKLALEEKNQELIKKNQELDNFVYSASHDFRAPLTSLKGLINITESSLNPDQEEQKKQLQMMLKTIGKMDVFIDDILDYSRNSSTEIDHEKIDFEALIQSICDNLKYKDCNETHKKSVHIDQSVDFYSDKHRIEIIFNNIISNAIEYSDATKDENYINITINSNAEEATIVIEDNGIGIDNKHLDKIFGMFYRATKFSKGSGMGLYIVKETIDKLKGSITVESRLNEGSKFTVSLPNLN
ncbi:PAS domain S-box-containing protein [Mariniflexile fucanivorans]|uniref:histidine kinase n=1 Tax=Mariniflexile fucanivorans TaxID=264023 RepID=A0A4R1RGT1_9FLAO|nr:ATP-binding protein [Mariniflexile fucanivorans]TCL65099.1 PAS domain S-box-containing protein [Mariniflexile fucanivorans]